MTYPVRQHEWLLRIQIACAVLILSGASAGAAQFTFNPNAIAGISGVGNVVADNLGLSSYATIKFTPVDGNTVTFDESGTLAVGTFKLHDNIKTDTGLNTQFGLYFTFTGSGDQTNYNAQNALGYFSTLHFDFYGYRVTSPVTYIPMATTPVSVSNTVKLASGDLISGGTAVINGGPAATANTTFQTLVSNFFIDPAPFYNAAFSQFGNTGGPNQVSGSLANGFVITNGGGSANFSMAIPEPLSISLFGAGLAAFGVARLRRWTV